MEIADYKLGEFLRLEDNDTVYSCLAILDHLQPLHELDNPRARRWNKEPKKAQIKAVRDLSFADVTNIRNWFNEGTVDAVLNAAKLVTGLEHNELLVVPITQFYGMIATIRQELIAISNMENELTDDHFDMNLEQVNAEQRMGRFGVLNTIDSLAGQDILKWGQIEQMPYMQVFAKLLMDKERNAIQRELQELQRKKLKS